MPRKYKYSRPKTSTMSTTPVVYALHDMVKTLNLMNQKFPKRIDRGRELFLLEMAKILREEVRTTAPEIEIGGDMVNYAEKLRIGILGEDNEEDMVFLYVEGATAKVTEDSQHHTVLYVQPYSTSPKWMDVLMKFGPWPAAMMPVAVKASEGRLVSRKARPDEINALSVRIYERKEAIEALLKEAGAENPRIGESGNGVGVVVHEDLGYNVLRKEFGYDGEEQKAHWRPAMKAMKAQIPLVMNKFVRYLMTGRESVFDLPDDAKDATTVKFKEGARFAKTLAPFAPKG